MASQVIKQTSPGNWILKATVGDTSLSERFTGTRLEALRELRDLGRNLAWYVTHANMPAVDADLREVPMLLRKHAH